jgi:hypothetical protein
MKRYIWILPIVLLCSNLMAEVHSQAGDFGYKFLNIPATPLSLSMAGLGFYSAGNNGAWIMQPANSAMHSDKSASASHSTWLGDTAYTSLIFSHAKRSSHIGLAIRNLSYGEIDKRDETGTLLGTYNPADVGISGNYALRLTPSLYAGANLSVAYQKLDTASAMALVADLGVSTRTLLKDSQVSIALRNLGISNKMDEESIKLPYSIDLSVYKGFRMGEQHLSLEGAVIAPPDADPQLMFATELTLLERLNLRAGYKMNSDSSALSAGFGVNISHFNLDYGFAPYEEGLGDVHSFGLSYHF